MNHTDSQIVLFIGALASILAIAGLVWKFALSHAKNHQDHSRIIHLLEGMKTVGNRLDDVLKHPDETAFSVEPVRTELRLIQDKLKDIEERIKEMTG